MSGARLYWIDLETTGPDPQSDSILEIAVFEATPEEPFTAREIYCSRVFGPEPYDDFVREMHTRSGLLAELSDDDPWPHEVQKALLDIIPEPEPDRPRHTLAGSSAHFDLSFLRADMPTLAARFSHRLFDVSAMELLARNLGMPKPAAESEKPHRARADVIYSIEKGRQIRDWLAGRKVAAPSVPVRVFIASPYAGEISANAWYARRAMLDSFERGEAPFVPHLLYTQVLPEDGGEGRQRGLEAAKAMLAGMNLLAVYEDRGVSSGMSGEIEHAARLGIPVERRRIGA